MYDPLISQNIGAGQDYPSSYWFSQPQQLVNTPRLHTDLATDIVVVGAGYTGLSCAYKLADSFDQDVTVVEANQIGWGCSGRNAGFVLRGTGRLGQAQLTQRFGLDTAKLFHQEYGAAIEQVQQMIAAGNIDCRPQQPGYYKVAHKRSMAGELQHQGAWLKQHFNYDVSYVSAGELQEKVMRNQQAHGALHFPDCFGVDPLALVLGYAALCKQVGVQLYTGTPVLHWQRQGSGFTVHTPEGMIRCKKLILATNGYTPKDLYPLLNRACLPVLSSVIVTDPLTQEQMAQCNLLDNYLVMDTRALKYYYRKLPDNRLLFGGRSAIYGKDAEKAIYPQRLLTALKACFPALQSVTYQYHWSGWVAVSYDDLPRICSPEPDVFYAAGYCGSGVSFSSLAGRRMAELVMQQQLPELPLYNTALKSFPLASMRRYGQQLYYQWGRFKDQYL